MVSWKISLFCLMSMNDCIDCIPFFYEVFRAFCSHSVVALFDQMMLMLTGDDNNDSDGIVMMKMV